jgi:hypothetical protein
VSSLTQTLRHYVQDSDTSWGCGTFGAIAEFARDPGETVKISGDGLTAVTARGGMRLSPVSDIRPIAYELAGAHPDTWQHSLALCLPADRCRLTGRGVLTELGPDAEALRRADRETVLFDLGLAIGHADICVRTADPGAIDLVRKGLGRSLLSPYGLPLFHEIASLSPHRVFRCNFGRIEVYQPIPSPDDQTPPGPHTHVMPRLLALRRTHAATLPIPSGWVPCFTLFPPNPIRSSDGDIKPFDRAQYEAFQRLWERYGIPELIALKAAVFAALSSGGPPSFPDLSPPLDRAGRALVRVAQRQWRQLANGKERDAGDRLAL